ncbi:ABC transporter permease [Dactylosporangium sucinum]|uniref:ABC transporter permease n=1 Tax=Dactylosporangium sucinum TaxID=1424081 RepID=UPI00167DC5ED|nr:ABC transporter permease [Dactylosporangium sucinum]
MIGAAAALLVVLAALVGPILITHDPYAFVGRPFQAPGNGHLLGTDILGRDVLSGLLVGGREFLVEGIVATLLGVGAGLLVGVALALSPRRVGALLLSVNDTLIMLPQIVIALLVLTRLGATPLTLVLVVGLSHVPQSARVLRTATARVIEQDYFHVARSLGVSRFRLVTGEITPNIAGHLLVEFGIRLAMSVVVLASLSYLGFGSTGVNWGRMIHDNQGGLTIQPWAVLAPVIAIGVFLIGMNLLRDGLSRSYTREPS